MIISNDADELKLLVRELRQDIQRLEQNKCKYNIGANLLSIKESFLNEISIRVFYVLCIVEGIFKAFNP